MLRTSFAACQQPALSPHHRCLPFLYPSITMSRRPRRLSGHLNDSSPSSRINTLHGKHVLSTDAAAGPSSRPARADATTLIPYFEEWSTEALQAEVKRYGFKVSRKRSTLIDQLKAVYEALHRSKASFEAPVVPRDCTDTATATESTQVSRTKRNLVLPISTPITEGAAVGKGKGKGKGRKSDPFVLDGDSTSDSSSSDSIILTSHIDSQEAGDFTAQLELEAQSVTDGSSSDIPLSTTASSQPRRGRPPRSRSPSTSSSDIPPSTLTTEAQQEAVEPTPALAETMTLAIRTNPAVWERILRYEPISFDEFVSIASQNGLSMDSGKRKEELRTWLDRQCICFFSNDLTEPRSRH